MKARIDNCFVCSPDNPAGLHLRFDVGDGTSTAEFLLGSAFDGYHGVTHGGIQAAILDDAMANIFFGRELPVFTVDIHVRYHRPMYSDRKYRVEARLAEDRGSRIKATEACIKDLATGKVVTEATATFLIGRSLLETVRSKSADEHQQQESQPKLSRMQELQKKYPGHKPIPPSTQTVVITLVATVILSLLLVFAFLKSCLL